MKEEVKKEIVKENIRAFAAMLEHLTKSIEDTKASIRKGDLDQITISCEVLNIYMGYTRDAYQAVSLIRSLPNY